MPPVPTSDEKKIFAESETTPVRVPRSLKEQFLDFYYRVTPLFDVNLAWFVMSLPVVTILPALGGLYYAVLQYNQKNQANWGIVWEGVKTHWWLSIKWGVLVLLVDAILAVNIWFYTTLTQDWALFAVTASVVMLLVWLAINQYSFPVLLLQEEKKILLAIRNSFVLVMRQPLQAVMVLVLSSLLMVVSILFPPLLVFISMAVIVNLQTQSTLRTIKKIREMDAERDSAAALDPDDGEQPMGEDN